MTIDLLRAADEAAWRGLWDGYNAFYERAVTEDATTTLWAGLMDPAHPFTGFAARDGDRLIGFAHAFRHLSTAEPAGKLYLNDLFVDPSVRGGGHGRALIEAVYAEGERLGVAQVYWLTQAFNHTARKLYDRVGTATPFIKYTR